MVVKKVRKKSGTKSVEPNKEFKKKPIPVYREFVVELFALSSKLYFICTR